MGRKGSLLPNLEKGDAVEALLYGLFHVLECARPRCRAVLKFRRAPVLFNKVQLTMIFWIKVTNMAMRLDKLLQLGFLRAEIGLSEKHAPATAVRAIGRTLEVRALCRQPLAP